jgi:MFS family permease
LKSLAAEFEATPTAVYGAGTSFLLASTIFQPFFTELSHVVGRKPAFLLALVVFAAGSAVVGGSQSTAVMLVGRSIQGAGSSGPIALCVVILTDIFALRKRAQYIAGLNAVWTVGAISGPIIGGAFIKFTSWVRLVNTPSVPVDLQEMLTS